MEGTYRRGARGARRSRDPKTAATVAVVAVALFLVAAVAALVWFGPAIQSTSPDNTLGSAQAFGNNFIRQLFNLVRSPLQLSQTPQTPGVQRENDNADGPSAAHWEPLQASSRSIPGSLTNGSRPLQLPPPSAPFETWRQSFEAYALEFGISPATLEQSLRGVRPISKVEQLDRHQSEYTRTFFEYLRTNVTEARIARGRSMIGKHQRLLRTLQKSYGTPGDLLVALWAMESDFGSQIGDFPAIATLATLAYDGRRRELFTAELTEALSIVDSGQAKVEDLRSSWAGAMGQYQFLPSTYRRYGRDGDGDDRVDIWTSIPDVLHSGANYLRSIGWQAGERWGREVMLPHDFELSQARLSITKSLEEWDRIGVLCTDGSPLPVGQSRGAILLPAGYRGPAFLVQANFGVILQWNRSLSYALTVGHLADRLSGGRPLIGREPAGDKALPRSTVMALQRELARMGFDIGEPDGMVGAKTRDAVQDYQLSRGLPADGYPTVDLIARIDQEKTIPAVRIAPARQ